CFWIDIFVCNSSSSFRFYRYFAPKVVVMAKKIAIASTILSELLEFNVLARYRLVRIGIGLTYSNVGYQLLVVSDQGGNLIFNSFLIRDLHALRGAGCPLWHTVCIKGLSLLFRGTAGEHL